MPYRTPPPIDVPVVPRVDPRLALAVLVGTSAVQRAVASSWSDLALGVLGTLGGVYAMARVQRSRRR